MKKLKYFVGFLMLLAAPLGFADKQHIRYCFNVVGNVSSSVFLSGFKSSDIFDFGTFTRLISNGKECVEHIYKKGPKKIRFYINFTGHDTSYSFIPDSACYRIARIAIGRMATSYVKTTHSNEAWDFNLIQMPPKNGKYAYRLICKRTSND